MIACRRTYEKIRYVPLWCDYDGTAKLQGITLKRTGHKTRFKSRKSLGKRCHPDDIAKATFKLQIFIGISNGVGEQYALVTCHLSEIIQVLGSAVSDDNKLRTFF